MNANQIFGYVDADTLVLINLYLVKALKPFNLYQLHDEYRKDYGVIAEGQPGDDGFTGWLAQVKELIVFVELELDQEQLRDILQFDIRATIPGYDEINSVESLATPVMHELHFEQIRTLAGGLDFKVSESGEMVENLLQELINKPDLVVQDYVDLVIAINLPKVMARQKALQEQHGFSVMTVAQELGPNFSYTQKLSDNCEFEIIAIADTALNSLHMFVSEVAERVLRDDDFDGYSSEPFVSKVMTMLDSSEEVRLRLIDIPLEKVEALMGHSLPGLRFRQLYLGDLRNLLPGEDGCDNELFKQVL